MKQTLLLSAMLLAASSTATFAMTEREKPIPSETSGFQSEQSKDTYYYMWNVEAQLFFTEGNAWGTQASVGPTGLKVYFSKFEDAAAGTEWDGETYLLNCFSLTKQAWGLVFFNDKNSMFVDRTNQQDYGWAVDADGDTFRLHVATVKSGLNPTMNEESYPGTFVGLDVSENAENTALSPVLEAGEGHYTDWALVAPNVYEAYVAELDTYMAATKLYPLLLRAQEVGIDITPWETIYENLGSTVEELLAATGEVRTAIIGKLAELADWNAPQDMTLTIDNPDYSDSGADGWSGTAPTWAFGVVEHYNKRYDTYQDLAGLPDGVYALRVQGFYRAGSTAADYKNRANPRSRGGKMYATTDGEEVAQGLVSPFDYEGEPLGVEGETTYTDGDGHEWTVPNTMQAFASYATAGHYQNEMFFGTDNHMARIGMRKDTLLSTDWAIWDNWQLVYYGNAAEAYCLWGQSVADHAYDYEGVRATHSLIAEYREQAERARQADNRADIMAAIQAINALTIAIDQNIEAWNWLAESIEEAEETYKALEASGEWQGIGQEALLHLLAEATDAMEALTLTTAEVYELKDRLDEACTVVITGMQDATTATAPIRTEYFTLSGWQTARPQQGICIERTTHADGTVSTQKYTRNGTADTVSGH